MRKAAEQKWRRGVIAPAVLARGWSVVPDYLRPQAPLAATYPGGAAYELVDSAGAPAASETGWRDFFADPRLQELIVAALRGNRDLRVAILDVELLRAQFRIRSAQLFPQVAL